MGVDDVFGKVEKPAKEKKLEVITSVDATVDDLGAYFEQNKYEGLETWDGSRKYFNSCIKFLKSYKLSPEIISEFNTKGRSVKGSDAFGLYLSAMIQTSYNNGFNDFKFKKVDADCFCALLKGQPKNPIQITTETIKGNWSLFNAKNCSLTAETIEGYLSLGYTENCSLITNYQGEHFGWFMENCIIKSKNKKTLELIKEQTYKRENNKFELIK